LIASIIILNKRYIAIFSNFGRFNWRKKGLLSCSL